MNYEFKKQKLRFARFLTIVINESGKAFTSQQSNLNGELINVGSFKVYRT